MKKSKIIIEFESVSQEIFSLIKEWEPKLLALPEDIISTRKNTQNRTIRQILGHMVDSASNNTHRIVHLQYQPRPLIFHNYASLGNNDRWIAIQNYQDENWNNLVQLWKYSNLHIFHVIKNLNSEKLENEWIAAPDKKITLKSMIQDFPRHFKLHLNEIIYLINKV
jgi:hypothetical protein